MKDTMMRECPKCEGKRQDADGWACGYCNGTGYDPKSCEHCNEDDIGYNDDGELLCENCMFEWASEHAGEL